MLPMACLKKRIQKAEIVVSTTRQLKLHQLALQLIFAKVTVSPAQVRTIKVRYRARTGAPLAQATGSAAVRELIDTLG